MRTITAKMGWKYYMALLAWVFTLSFAAAFPLANANPPFQLSAGGMQFKDLKQGDGEPVLEGQVVRVHLVGWIDEQGQRGKELFNSRRERGPVSFVVGTEKVLPAFNEGVIGMKPGGRRLLMVPPVFAYGERGVDDVIPPNTRLVFLIDLLEVKSD